MLGVDWHMGTPGPPVPPFPIPHIVAQVLGGLMTAAQLAPKVHSHSFLVVKRGSDIGMGVGHIPLAPSFLAILLPFGSGSVSEFGAFSVQSEGAATAIALGVYVGINLNCSDPIPGASVNGVIAPGCNLANFTMADFGASMLSVAADIAITAVINGVLGAAFKGALNGVAGIANRISVSTGLTTALILSSKSGQLTTGAVESALGFFVGSPMGASADQDSIGNMPGNWTDRRIDDMMNNHYSNGEQLN